ncbi:MAG TPA: histidinol-phosphate transaminase [Gaiellales bacterium]|nr:histidinol-phosphate transaminase [Gaiellales bacterium]
MQPRPEIADLRAYAPGKPASELRRELGLDQVVKLASNEGPFGPFPAALEALEAALPELNRYPERALELTERLAERHGLTADRVAPGNGADAVIANLALAFLEPGDEVVMGWPSFVSYHLSTVKMGAIPIHVPLRNGSYDLEAMAERIGPATRLVYVCSPNNPTGGIVDGAALAAFLRRVPEQVLVVIDSAYHEYVADPGHVDAVVAFGDRPNVVVLRTFSKMFGLAGLRVGYGVAAPDVVESLGKVRGPFDVSELANAAAVASLGDTAECERRRELNRAERERLTAALEGRGLSVYPAAANFVCIEVGDGAALAARLEREGVIVRPLAPFGAPSCIRVTVGLPEHDDAFLAALDRCLQPA